MTAQPLSALNSSFLTLNPHHKANPSWDVGKG